uniref:Uncharacterized protein n=1 Tax=Laticauda laticaudata TaxID=8630 RepID=A0A8C5SNJ6_LATLA
MEGSGDDDSFEDEELEEMEDFYSGSGSGYFKQDPGSKSVVRLTTDSPIVLATTSAVMPVTSVQPVATPLAPLPTEEVISESATNGLYIPRISEVPAVTIWKAVGVTATPAAHDIATTTMTTTASSMATTASATTVTSRPTTALRDLLPVITIVAVTQSMMLETPTTATVARTEIPASPLGMTSETEVRDMAQLSTSQEPDVTTVPQPPTAIPTDAAQVGKCLKTGCISQYGGFCIAISGQMFIPSLFLLCLAVHLRKRIWGGICICKEGKINTGSP